MKKKHKNKQKIRQKRMEEVRKAADARECMAELNKVKS